MGFRISNGLKQSQTPIEEDLMLGIQGTPRSYQQDNMLAGLPTSEFYVQPQQLTTPEDYAKTYDQPRATVNEPPRELFRQQLGGQLADSTQAFEQGARERGALSPGMVESYKNRGIQIAGKVVAEKEFNEAVGAQNKAIKDLVETSGIKDQNMKYKFAQDLRDKMTKARIELLKFGQKAELQMSKMKADAAKKQAMAKALGAVAGGVIGGMIAGPGGAMMGAGAMGGFGSAPMSTMPRNTTADQAAGMRSPSFAAEPNQPTVASTAQPGDTGMRGDF